MCEGGNGRWEEDGVGDGEGWVGGGKGGGGGEGGEGGVLCSIELRLHTGIAIFRRSIRLHHSLDDQEDKVVCQCMCSSPLGQPRAGSDQSVMRSH